MHGISLTLSDQFSPLTPQQTTRQLNRQEQQLKLRTPSLVEPFHRARQAYESVITDELGLVDCGDLHSKLHKGPKRNVVRKVIYKGDQLAIKVFGDNDSFPEFYLLREWRRHGLPCFQPIGAGKVPQLGVSWILTSYEEITAWNNFKAHKTVEDKIRLTCEVYEFMSQFYESGASLPDHTTAPYYPLRFHLKGPLLKHFEPLHPYGVRPSDSFMSTFQNAAAGNVPLHGDLHSGNIFRVKGSDESLLGDPQDALIGHPNAEIGEFIGRLCISEKGQMEARNIVDGLCKKYPLDSSRVATLTATTLLLGLARQIKTTDEEDHGLISEQVAHCVSLLPKKY